MGNIASKVWSEHNNCCVSPIAAATWVEPTQAQRIPKVKPKEAFRKNIQVNLKEFFFS